MRGEPLYRTAHFGDDAIEPGRRSQRVFDDREIDPERQEAVGEKGETLLVVHLPVAAVDKRKRRGFVRLTGWLGSEVAGRLARWLKSHTAATAFRRLSSSMLCSSTCASR
jgi:hypothetical protein